MVFDLKDLAIYLEVITYTNNWYQQNVNKASHFTIYSFNKYLLSTYYVPGARLDGEHIKVVTSQYWPLSSEADVGEIDTYTR